MRTRSRLVIAALSVLVIGCGTNQITPTVTLPPATPTHVALPSPKPPDGWTIHHTSNIQVALPTSLHEIQLDESALKGAIEAAQSNNPPLAETLRGILDSGQFKSLLFYAVDTAATNVVTNVTVIQTTFPNGTRPQEAEQQYVDALPQLIKGASIVDSQPTLMVNGQPAFEVDYDLPLVNQAGRLITLRGIQFMYQSDSGDGYVLTVTGDAAGADTLTPLGRQIGASFYISGP